jgi:acyl-coenzyme A synthetase/AMP-(fatty) acid ligase
MKRIVDDFPSLEIETQKLGVLIGSDIQRILRDSTPYASSETAGWQAVRSESREGPLFHFYVGVLRRQNLIMCPPGYTDEQVFALSRVLGHYYPPGGEGYAAFLTSGSSGVPKAVIHSHQNLLRAAQKILDRYPNLRFAKMHHLFPAHYMAGVLNGLLVPWIGGGGLFLDKVFDFSSPYSIGSTIERFNTSSAWLSPTMMRAMTEAWRLKQAPPRLWDFALSATGPLSTHVRDEFDITFGTTTHNTYGSSELLFIASETERMEEVSVGRLFPGVESRFGSNIGSESAVSGALLIQSDTACLDVFSFNQATFQYEPEQNGVLEYFDTKDYATLDPNGLISVTDRTDDFVVLGGINYSLNWIENVALNFAGIVACSAFAPFGGEAHELTLAYEISPDLDNFRELELMSYLRSSLKEFCPRRLIQAPLPRTHSGKISRSQVMMNFVGKGAE